MTDIYHEIQEDIRRDRMKALWARYGVFLVALAALVVLGVGGWRGYSYYEAKQAAAAGDRYQAAAKLAEDGRSDEARAAFAAIAVNSPYGYRALARLREADEVAKTDQPTALRLYQEVADGSGDSMLRDAARVRAAYLAVDVGAPEDVRRLAEPLAAGGPWSALAREALGLSAYKAEDTTEARRQFEAIVADADAPGATRQRADLLLAVLPQAAPEKPAADKPTN
ncbi:tetratricopeptide repeat protein [Hansschlegelia plantiphila]|uniref:Ancillary SecYEG translocon subunit/Cell division coordinator CpoB TPR domain-containing protein n=1 Tax=Hansschlegelia plantiphila TaxID=374655 RepID=A0A9W6MX87_9HYPH|nr:tetratricopeptide repeat protein [Hansschlegelia plantiphila]GLK69627.1 hypothetical protein GCM10008179_32650 [Hansschlegelia plantiphila]